MAVNEYDCGDRISITGTFAVGGAATDPTTITLKIKDPAGTTTTYTYAGAQITRTGVGAYRYDLTISALWGTWRYRWIGTGVVSEQEHSFFVRRPRVS